MQRLQIKQKDIHMYNLLQVCLLHKLQIHVTEKLPIIWDNSIVWLLNRPQFFPDWNFMFLLLLHHFLHLIVTVYSSSFISMLFFLYSFYGIATSQHEYVFYGASQPVDILLLWKAFVLLSLHTMLSATCTVISKPLKAHFFVTSARCACFCWDITCKLEVKWKKSKYMVLKQKN